MKSKKPVHRRVIIIGAGSAGLSAIKVIKEETNDYLLVDKGPLGTMCARVGCMPSKALIESAKLLNYQEKLQNIPVRVSKPNRLKASPAVFNHVRKMTKSFVKSVLDDMKKIPKKNFIRGEAKFIDKNTLRIGSQDFTADRFIIATGSYPVLLPQFEDLRSKFLFSDDIFKLSRAPKSMAVIGSGAIGIELALALRDLGTKVTVFGSQRGIGGLTDPDLVEMASEILGKKVQFIPFDVETIQQDKTKKKFIVKFDGSKKTFDYVLMATGRKPNLGLLANLDLQKDEKGRLKFDPETGHVPGTHFYIAGDANSTRPVLHEASFDGVVTGLNAVRSKDQHVKPFVPLRITFSAPQIAVVGKSHKELTTASISFDMSEVSFSDQGRSKTKFENEGHLKLYIHPKKRTLLGAELFNHSAEHLAHFLALAMTHNLAIEEILETPIYHPVIEEGLRTALRRGLQRK